MKAGAFICLAIFIAWVFLALLQLWFGILSSVLFWKLTITASALFVVVLGATLVIRDYMEDKKLKDDGYLDS
jgi:membrane protein implicated in regulation of membrane protease activity